MDFLTVNEFDGRDQRLEHDVALFTGVYLNAVQFSLDIQCGALRLEHVDDIVHLGVLHNQIWIIFLVFDDPLFAVLIELGRFDGSGGRSRVRTSFEGLRGLEGRWTRT